MCMHVQDALADAVQQRNSTAVGEGLLRGGRADRPDKAGRIPVLLAASLGHISVLQAILQHNAERTTVNLKMCGLLLWLLVFLSSSFLYLRFWSHDQQKGAHHRPTFMLHLQN